MRAPVILIGLLSVGLSNVGCSDELPPPHKDKPSAPASNDPAYTVAGIHDWYLVSTQATTADELMTIRVAGPSGTEYVDAYIADLPPVRLASQPNGELGKQIDIAAVPPGTHDVLLSANGSTAAFAKISFKRSAPYYVLVTTDWDFSDPGDQANTYQDFLHQNHPELVMTHFIGPYTFTDPAVTPQRQAELVAWALKQKEMHGDEIGLHIHPYCNFVTAAGLPCVTDQSTVYTMDVTGYTIKLGAYNRQEFGVLLDYAKTLFAQHGLPTPRTFRAGGWTATLDTLGALQDKGFIADTSALNWARIEEWEGDEMYRWNKEQWASIGDTSQPYRPNVDQILATDAPTLELLEVPDNGVMIDYVTLPEMNGLFDANWTGEPLSAPITLMMGFHPATPGFSESEFSRVNGFLSYADEHLASRDLGPVVYITLEDVVAVFPQ
ncbi:MAG: hypothetical protein AB7O24_20980 [Kofleriaceae bacterium]